MGKKVVVYVSKTGFTQKYAGWIAEELGCSVMDIKEWKEQNPAEYQTVIYGGGFYAGSIKGLKKMKEQMKNYPGIKFIVFGTGATPASEEETIRKTLNANFTEEEQKKIPSYYFQAGLNYDKMSVMSKLMMKMFASMMNKKADKTEDEKVMTSMLAESYDFSDKDSIRELVEYARQADY